MSALPPRPVPGARAAHPPAHDPKKFGDDFEPVPWPTAKEAYELCEFFKAGTRTDVILLGEPVEVAVHHVTSKRSKVLCTKSTGVCECCQVSGTSAEVSEAQTEYHTPALRREKDRRFHQCIAVFTAKQFRDQVAPLVSEEGARGVRLDVHRVSTQKADIKPVKGSARARSASLPGSFDLLPWIRARWNRPQNPLQPAVRIAPLVLAELDRGPARPVKGLALTADDRLPPEELDAVRAKMAEARALFNIPAGAATPIDPPAPVPVPQPAPVPPAPIAAPAPAPRPAPVQAAPAAVEPAPQPATVAPTPAAPPTLPPAPATPTPVLPTAFSAAAFTLTVPPAPSAPPAALFVAPPPPPPPVPPAPTPAGFVVVAPPVCPPPLGRAPVTAPPAPVPTTPIVLDTATKIEADLKELAELFPARASTGMVPPIGRVIAGQQAQIRERLAEAHREEDRRRAEQKRRTRDGHDPGDSPPQGVGGALDVLISAVAKGGVQ